MTTLFIATLRHNLRDTFALLSIALLRLIKQIDHATMKASILERFNTPYYNALAIPFAKRMQRYVSDEVLTLMHAFELTILATAAPEVYAKEIATLYGFDYTLATPMPKYGKWQENIRDIKAKNLQHLLKSLHVKELDAVVSDHHDDIPLMRLAKRVYLHNATQRTYAKLKSDKISYTVV